MSVKSRTDHSTEKQLIDNRPAIFRTAAAKKKEDHTALIETLYQKTGQYQIEMDWFKKIWWVALYRKEA